MITAAVYHNLKPKKTHTKNSSCNNPSSTPPKKTQPHTLICKTPCFSQNSKSPNFKIVYSTDVLKSFLTTTRKEHTQIKLQPKTGSKKTGLGSLVWNFTQEASHSTLIHAR
jgi:hypothetical protein